MRKAGPANYKVYELRTVRCGRKRQVLGQKATAPDTVSVVIYTSAPSV